MDLIDGDMRDFQMGRRFGLVFVARNSLLHLSSVEDIVATFTAIRRHLAPGVYSRSTCSIPTSGYSHGPKINDFPS